MVVVTFTVIAVAGLVAALAVERLLRGHLKPYSSTSARPRRAAGSG
jgi:hypothetical protein